MNEITAASAVALLPAVMFFLRYIIARRSREAASTKSVELLLKDAEGHKVEIVFGKDSTAEERAELVGSKVQELMGQRTA